MPQKTHYQDDLFVLSVLVKGLDACLSVKADPEYFREHVVGNVLFLDSTIRNFASMLIQNSHLIDRLEYLKLLEKTARGYSATIARLLAEEYPRSESYKTYGPQLGAILKEQRSILAEMEVLLKLPSENDSEVDLVSSDELSELLRG